MAIARRFRIILTARLLLEYREHTLYLLQTKANGGGYTLPGGKIEGEEFAKEALVRETFEEAGIVVPKKNLELVHVMHKQLKSTTEIIFFFKSKNWKGDLVVGETDKFQDVVWFPNDEPPKRLPAVIQAAMEKIQRGKVYSQYPTKEKEKKKEKTVVVAVKKVAKKPIKKAAKAKSDKTHIQSQR